MKDDRAQQKSDPGKGQFRFAYFTPKYDETIAFYRHGLEFTVIEAWDRTADDKGTIFEAASGMIEVLALPSGDSDHLWDRRPPQGAFIVIEVESVELLYQSVLHRGLPIQEALKEQAWGHRGFCIREPNGLIMYFFSEMRNGK
jgi:catechol 2,3-dioxygenase-like lactoylglutathione lyase family enzyme